MNEKSILVVDDESYIREFLAEILSCQYKIFLAKSGADALKIAPQKNPSLIILDINMPGKSGLETCRELRNHSATKMIPVLMLTAVSESEQRTKAYAFGADDYMTKPFSPDELLARVDSKMRRLDERDIKEANSDGLVKFGDLTLNFLEFKSEIAGKAIEFGQIELKILNCLIQHQGQLVGREVINDFVWGSDMPAERALDPHITSLRKKLRLSNSQLKTVYGRGYCLLLQDSAA